MNKTTSAIVRTLLLGTTCLSVADVGAALADPTGGTVVTGSATIASNGNSTIINQSTNRALINWDSFSIAAGGSVRFNQPGTGSITLNRVIGSAPSSIYGSILANGQVWLINSNGILFGRGAQVNVGGLLATTSNISDRDFANGQYNFSGGSGASVVNQGTIRARSGGSVVLSGASVQNQGLIQADAGTVVLGGASAFTVDFDGDNLLRYAISAPAGAADNGQTGVSNSGTINANNGGRVIMTARAAADIAGAVINNTGIITATSAKVQNGEVVLDGGDGDVAVGGTIDATGTGTARTGGFVTVTGRNITVADNANINVSGDAGGGTVRIGGDVHGGGTLAHAQNVTIGKATIKADATRRGNGGTFVVWSNGLTDFSGIVSAMGGAAGGNGGFVETSGAHLKVGDAARIDTRAPRGNTGTWLLDPTDIDITSSGTDSIGGSNINPLTIINALNSTNVALEASHDITVDNAVNYNSANRLSLLAQNNITVNASIQNAGAGAIDLIAGWDGSTVDAAHFTDAGVFGVGGDYVHGSIYFNTAAVGSHGGTTTVAGWKLSLSAFSNDAFSQVGYRGSEGGGGDIRVNTVNNLSLSTNSGVHNALVQIGNGDKLGSVTANVTGNIAIDVGGNTSLALNAAGIGQAIWIGNVSNGGTASGNLRFVSGSISDDSYEGGGGSASIFPMLGADAVNGDVLFALTNATLTVDSAIAYNSAHALSLLSKGTLLVNASIQNGGSGAINLIAGWDGTTTDLAHLADAGVFGNNSGNFFLTSFGSAVSVGSHGGPTTVAGASVTVRGISGGPAQLGYNGVGGGDIAVRATGDITLRNGGTQAMIGNGSIGAAIAGDITGNITLDAAGTFHLDNEDGDVTLGNRATSGHTSAGNLTVLANGIVNGNESNILESAIAYTLAGGDVTIGSRVSDLTFESGIGYSSGHTLSLLSGGGINIDAEIHNIGSGAINLIAGWDGTTLTPASFTADGVYGNGHGSIQLGASVGGTGTTTLAGYNITQTAAIATGTLDAYATGNIYLDISADDESIMRNAVATASFHAAGDVYFNDDQSNLTLKASTAGGFFFVANDTNESSHTITVDGLITAGASDCGCDVGIDLEAGGSLTQTANGAFSADRLYASSQTGDVTLDNEANAIDGDVSLFAYDGSVTFVNDGDFTMVDGESDGAFAITSLNGAITLDGEVTAGGVMTITALGDIDETEGGSLEGGALNATSTTGSIALFGLNDLTGTITLNADGDAALLNDDATVLGDVTVGGQLYVQSTGDVTQADDTAIVAGSLAVAAGDFFCEFECGDADVTLNSTGNTIAGDVAFNVLGDVEFTDSVGFSLGHVDFMGLEDHTYISGELTATALTGGITITDGVETGLFTDPTLTADGDITETEDGYITGGDLNATSTNGRIVLLGENDLFGTVSLNAHGDALFANQEGVELGTSTIGGTLFVSAQGDVTQSGTLTAANLAIDAVANDCGCSNGDVVLDDPTNAISGSVAFQADGDVTFTNANGFTLGNIDNDDFDKAVTNAIGGSLTATALTGDIVIDDMVALQTESGRFGSGSSSLTAAGDVRETASGSITAVQLSVTAQDGAVTLDNADNDIVTLALNAADDASYRTAGSVALAAGSIGGSMTVLAGEDIDVIGSYQSAGDITLIAGWSGEGDPESWFDDGNYGLNDGSVTIGGGAATGNVAIGSSAGATNVYGANLTFDTSAGNAQLGYHGAGGGDIFVKVTQNINGFGNGENTHSLQLGNGTLTNDVVGNVTGNIDLDAGNQTVFFSQMGAGWLGNHASAGYTESGNVTSVSRTGSYSADYMQADLGTSADTGGNLFIGFRDNLAMEGFHIGGIEYNSPHALVFANAGSLDVTGRVINNGSGDVTLVAGWDGHTIGSAAQIKAAHAYGLNNTFLNVGGNHHYGTDTGFNVNQFENVSVGSHGGLTSVLGGNLTIAPAANYYAQIGYHGTGGGAIDVAATGDLTMTGGAAVHDYAMIGNGSLNGDVTGNITGNIAVHVAGTTTLTEAANGAPVWLGNVAGNGFTETGDLLVVTGLFEGESRVSDMIAASLAGGDVTIGITNSAADNEVDSPILYNSNHVLTLLTAGSLTIASTVQNAGTGAINVVTGWNGTTFDAAHFGDAGVYGNHGGSLFVGTTDAAGNAAIGSRGGAISVYASDVMVDAAHGYAQIGYHGAGTGAVNVTASGQVKVFSHHEDVVAQIGNGGIDVAGSVGGAVTVSSADVLFLAAGYQRSTATIGNVTAAGGSQSGNVTVNTHGAALVMSATNGVAHAQIGNWTKGGGTGTTSGDVKVDGGQISLSGTTNGFAMIGNGTLRFGSATGNVSGNVTVHATDFYANAGGSGQARIGNLGYGSVFGDVSLITTGLISLEGNSGLVNIGNVSAVLDGNGDPAQSHAEGNLLVQSGGTLSLIALNGGNARIETGGAVAGSLITVSAVGDITLSAGQPGSTPNPNIASFAFIGTLLAGNGGANISVTSSTGGVYLNASEANGRAAIGNQQNGDLGGTLTGTVYVSALNAANGNVSLSPTGAGANAQIGNTGSSGETLGGDVTVLAGNTVQLGAGNAIIGNLNSNPGDEGPTPASFTGNVLISGKAINGNLAPSLSNDLSGGDVLLKILGPSFTLGGSVAYSSSHVLSVLAAGNVTLAGGIQNGGMGAINIVAGWDGQTLDAAHFFDAGHFGNGGATLTIGGAGATGNVAVGSFGGATNIGAASISLLGVNGYAQVGYHGVTGGTINVRSTGALVLTGSDEVAADWAMIGNGQAFAADAGGDVNITAGSVQSGGNSAVAGNHLSLTATGGDIGGLEALLRIDAATLTVSTAGGSVFLYSPDSGVVFAGINTGGGGFSLDAGGAITQTAAIHTGQTRLTTSEGDITLTDADNGFGALTIATPGNATLVHSSLLTIAGAHVDGTLKLTAGGAINQSGAIVAGALDVTSGAGGGDENALHGPVQTGIMLTDAGNSFGALTVHVLDGQDATVVDSIAVNVVGASVAGARFKLTAGGAITQSGAIVADVLDVATTVGAITLNHASNQFAGLTVLTHNNDSAAFVDYLGLTILGANVGGTLTVNAGGALGQSAAIQAAALNVSAVTGAITLNVAGNSFGTLSVLTHGGANASIVDSAGVSIASANVGGTFTLAAGGAITQTGALHAAGLNVSTTHGAIALNDAGNSFATLNVTTHGSDDAGFADSTGLTVASAAVGGALTINAGGAIGQSAAIHAAALNVSTTTGAIALNDAGNSFAALGVTTHGTDNASITDATGVIVSGATVGGTLTLAAGGAMSQTGAIHSAALNVSTTTGAIAFTNGGNAFGPLTVVTHGNDNAAFAHASLLTVASATVGGTLSLTGGTGINQSGAIVAAGLNATATTGNIVLTNASNSFGTLAAHTATGANDATITDLTGVVLTGVSVGGTFTLNAGGAVSQSAAIAAQRLNVTTTTGAIALTGLANAVTGTVQFSTPGAAAFYNTVAMNVGVTAVGGDLTLLSRGNINFKNSVQSTNGNITVVAGWDGVTVAPASFGNAGVYGNNSGPTTGNIVIGGTGAAGDVAVGSKNGSTSLYGNNVVVVGNVGTAQLGYHGTGGGAILVRALHDVGVNAASFSAMIGNGSLTGDVQGNITGDIDVRAAGNVNFLGTAATWFGNNAHGGTETGNVILVGNDVNNDDDHKFITYITAALGGGDVTLGFTGSDDQGPDQALAYSSSHTLNILTAGNFIIAGAIQNAGTGAINVVAGWDGHTVSAQSYGTAGVYGNNGKGVVIGGNDASGNAALGSAGGQTSVYGASLALSAVHGYAQLGFNGHGSGAILVKTIGGVTLTGGAGADQFAQIGNGGKGTSGSNSGDIAISAGGDLTLNAGAGAEAYAQIGHGGAENNAAGSGYTNAAPITVSAANVLLNAGSGAAAYVQIGNGGYKTGAGLTGGHGDNGGAVTVTSGHAVSLNGNGADAYAQIGNGGSQVNANAAASAGGTIFGNIVVHAPNGALGSVTLMAGPGANAYAQIGNGGYAINSGPTSTVANFTVSGDVTVTDLSLNGGNTGPNAFAQIGNGDASLNGTGNISGNIVIDANGQITYVNGTALHSPATIGNFTGHGTVSGTVSGANPPSDVTNNPVVIGVVVDNTAGNNSPTDHNNGITTIPTLVVVEDQPNGNSAVHLENATPGPLASLEGGEGDSGNASDNATIVIADSLDGAHKSGSTTILSGMLKAAAPGGGAVGAVPPADQDFSSWGNEALWQ